MAAALGMLLGGGLGFLQQKEQKSRQQKDEFADLVAQQVVKSGDASVLKDKHAKAAFEYKYGEGAADDFGQMIGGLQQMRQQAMQYMAGQQQQGQGGQGGKGGSQIPQYGTREYWNHMLDRSTQAMTSQDPQIAGMAKNFFSRAKEGLADLEKQESLAGKQEISPYQAASLNMREKELETSAGLKEAAMSQAAAEHETANAIREEALSTEKNFRQQSLDASRTKEEDARKAKVADLAKSLDAMRENVLAGFQKSPSANAKPRVDSYNASARLFFRRHADAGAPILLKYTETPGLTHGIFGNNPGVVAVPPQYGTNKKTGQSGWRDADGNFYPDASSD